MKSLKILFATFILSLFVAGFLMNSSDYNKKPKEPSEINIDQKLKDQNLLSELQIKENIKLPSNNDGLPPYCVMYALDKCDLNFADIANWSDEDRDCFRYYYNLCRNNTPPPDEGTFKDNKQGVKDIKHTTFQK